MQWLRFTSLSIWCSCIFLDFISFSEVLMKDRCKLFCRVAGNTAYYQLKDRVIDGTPCGPDTSDICVQGLCRVSVFFFFLRCSITPSLVWHVLQWWLVLTFLYSMNPSPFLLFVEDSVPLDVAWVYVSKVPPQTVIHSALELSSLPYLHCVSAASGLWPYFKLQGQER